MLVHPGRICLLTLWVLAGLHNNVFSPQPSGELYHKGIDITYGVRCLLVCFTDGMNPKILDDSKAEDDKEDYEKNVVLC